MTTEARGQVNQCLYHARLHLDYASEHVSDKAFAQSRMRCDLAASVMELYRAIYFLAMELGVFAQAANNADLSTTFQLQEQIESVQASKPSAAISECIRLMKSPALQELCAAYTSLWRCPEKISSNPNSKTVDKLLKIKDIEAELSLNDCQNWLQAVRQLVDNCRAADVEF